MQVNYDCLKDILSVFASSKQAEISIADVVKEAIIQQYAQEELKSSLSRLNDSRLIITGCKSFTEPYKTYFVAPSLETISWNPQPWRLTAKGEELLVSMSTPEVWQQFVKKAKDQPLDAAFQIITGLRKKYIDQLIED